jgi:hypothetical protein
MARFSANGVGATLQIGSAAMAVNEAGRWGVGLALQEAVDTGKSDRSFPCCRWNIG